MKKPTFRTSLRDQQRQIKTAMEGMARLYGTTLPEGALSDVKPKRYRDKPLSISKSESDVQSEIIDFLLTHPAVILVERINAGAVYNANGGYIQFHHIYLPKRFKSSPIERAKMRAADLSVTLIDAKRMVIECKREDWVKPCNEREYEQANYLKHISDAGGIGIFANSVDAVRKALIINGY